MNSLTNQGSLLLSITTVIFLLIAQCSQATKTGSIIFKERHSKASIHRPKVRRHTVDGNLKFDKNEFSERIQEWILYGEIPGDRTKFVEALKNESFSHVPKNFNVMVYDLEQNHRSRFVNLIGYHVVSAHGGQFGVWVFECGAFTNEGFLSPTTWNYAGDFFNYDGGKGVYFLHPNCTEPAYRENNHYSINAKDYQVNDHRLFDNVESARECATKTIEIEKNAAVYEPGNRTCFVKVVSQSDGEIQDSEGNRLGNFDIKTGPIEQTRDKKTLQVWYEDRKCDLIHVQRDGTHSCKKLPDDIRFVAIFMRRD